MDDLNFTFSTFLPKVNLITLLGSTENALLPDEILRMLNLEKAMLSKAKEWFEAKTSSVVSGVTQTLLKIT